MKALYLSGSICPSDEQRKQYAGWRIENADAFQSVARGVDSAVVMGDYPNIVDALKKADVEVSLQGEDSPASSEGEDIASNHDEDNIELMVEYFRDESLTTKPGVGVVEEALGIDTNGKEIDVAWTKFKAE